jgi:hemerythrin
MTEDSSPSFTWHDEWLLGYAPMDEVHEAFVEVVGRMLKAPEAQLAGLLDEFEIHAKQHFDAEDRWMVETGFPARACHIDEHAAVLRSVQGIRRQLVAGNPAAVRRLALELQAWFPGHAQHLDSALAHWMCQLRLGGPPVVLRRRIGPASHEPLNHAEGAIHADA